MTVQTSSNLSNSVVTVYMNRYLTGAQVARLYDQIAVPYDRFMTGKPMKELMKGSAVQVPFLSDMRPGTSAISTTTDVTPQTLSDAVASITPTSRGEALQWAEELDIKTYTDYTAKAFEMVGANAQETIELLAQAAATQGSWVERATARASLDAGTATHRASDANIRKMTAMMQTLKLPGFVDNMKQQQWAIITHPFVLHDIQESGNVDVIGQYQDAGIHLNFELAKLGPFRFLTSAYAKVFGGAGADNGTNVATTLAATADALGTTITTAADVSANVAAGMLWTIGTEETANTHYATNERVKVLSASGTTITILGEGPNGGLRFRHEIGEAVRNADSVYTAVLAGPQSLLKLYATDVGEFGKVVGPKKTGTLEQWNTLGHKFYGGYGRLSENRLVRLEFSTSYEA